jgi:hypothetical protein
MLWLTEDAVVLCEHKMGKVQIAASQSFCTINGRKVLVDDDPERKGIAGCPNANVAIGMKPCVTTLRVIEGYCDFIRIGGHRVCLDTVHGLTDGTPAGLVRYVVRDPGQKLVNLQS